MVLGGSGRWVAWGESGKACQTGLGMGIGEVEV